MTLSPKRILYVMVLALWLAACDGKNGGELPPATGLSGDTYLVMDSTQWKGELGAVIDSLFGLEMPGLPRKERIFNLRWIDPLKMNFVLRQRRNIIYAVTLDKRTRGARKIIDIFTEESISKIKDDPSFFVATNSNVHAVGQEVMYLFGNTEEQLIENVRANGRKLIEHFNKAERDRLVSAYTKAGQVKGTMDWMRKNFKASMVVPFGYKLVINNEEFLWIRQINPRDDKDVFVYRTDYTSQDQFKKDALIALRDEVCKKYLFEDPEVLDSYLITETTVPYIPVETKEVTLNGKYAVQMRGLWRANNFSMGGPFISYALVDEALGKFYYIEGFTFSPSKDQREIIRELDTILNTFETSEAVTTQ